MMMLDKIQTPKDLKNLSVQDLKKLCEELRSEIIRITSNNGGHLGSNLGIVEIVVAAHYVFDCPNDRFIFDVGHQSYAHKLLTGRRKLMENLRTSSGASGFCDPDESPFDSFISGHASTSLSAAVGFARARDLKKEKFSIISFLGDGSLSGGMIFEAMNNIENLKNFIVILNDNQMSISESVGTMHKYLTTLLSSKKALSLRRLLRKTLQRIPEGISKLFEKILKNTVYALKGQTIFEDLGFQYLGPVDGHDLEKLVSIFQNVRDIANYKPVLIHAITQKGKGYDPAEKDITRLHGIENHSAIRFSDIYGKKITELARRDPKIVCITAAMKSGCGLSKFAQEFPDRFFDVGIAEEHAVTFAAGLAKEGLKPFVSIYSTFLQRAFDQIYHDVCLQNLPVRFIIDKAGFPGADGKTHSGIFDIALLQHFHNFKILVPASSNDLMDMLDFAAGHSTSPLAIRYPKTEVIQTSKNQTSDLAFRTISTGTGTVVFFCGPLQEEIFAAVNISKTNPTIINVRTVKPFDIENFINISEKYNKVLIIEEGIIGGLSGEIFERLNDLGRFDIFSKMEFICASKIPADHESRSEQINRSKLSSQNIAAILRK